MKLSPKSDFDKDYHSFIKLIQIMRDDPVINQKVITTLKLDSFQRRTIINNWMEQLHEQRAFEGLCQALSCLFDDNIAAKVLKIINHNRI